MKKVLILCYDFPPLPSVGSQRPAAWLKYFPKFNISPTIITRKWKVNISNEKDYFAKDKGSKETIKHDNGSTIIKVPFKSDPRYHLLETNNILKISLRKIHSAFEILLRWFIPYFDTKRFIYKEAKKILSQNKKFDLIIVTGEPFILFKYGYKLSKQFNIPWVGDYRDGWFTDHIQYSFLHNILTSYEKKLEKKYLNSMLFYTVVTKKILIDNQRFFAINKKGIVHNNGVDLDLLSSLTKSKDLNKSFTICYAGSLLPQHNVSDFLNGYKKLFKKYPTESFKVKFIGIKLKPTSSVTSIRNFRDRFPQYVDIIPALPYKGSLQQQLSSDILLKFDFTGQHKGLLGSKLYEYAATKKPILTVLSIENKETTFFPNRKVQYMTSNENEVFHILDSLYIKYSEGINLNSDITNEEIFSFSREKYIKDLCNTIIKNLESVN